MLVINFGGMQVRLSFISLSIDHMVDEQKQMTFRFDWSVVIQQSIFTLNQC